MRLRQVALGVVTSLAMASVVIVSPAESAPRDWPKMAVSRDGKTWTRSMGAPLFPRSMVWVPGDRMTRSFLVRNQSGERATLAISVLTPDRDRWLRTNRLHLYVKSGQKKWRPVRVGRTRVVSVPMAVGKVRRIQVRVVMDRSSGNSTMNRSLTFRLKLRMTSAPTR